MRAGEAPVGREQIYETRSRDSFQRCSDLDCGNKVRSRRGDVARFLLASARYVGRKQERSVLD